MFGDGSFIPELYTLVDEEGHELTFEALDSLEIDDAVYYAMLPYFENPEEALESDAELVIMKVIEVDDEELFAPIEDEKEFEKVYSTFIEHLDEIFDFDDEDCDCGCCHHDHDHECDCGCDDDCDCDCEHDCGCDDDCDCGCH